MPLTPYTLAQAEEDIAALRGDSTVKEEFQEIGDLLVDNTLTVSGSLIVSGTITATGGTAGLPTLITTDSWHNTGSMAASWGKGTGFFKYRLLTEGMVAVCAQALTIGTVADGTTVVSAANGLPTGYAPATDKSIVADTNFLKTAPVGSGSFENARLTFKADGSVTCNGFGLSATYCNINGIFPTSI